MTSARTMNTSEHTADRQLGVTAFGINQIVLRPGERGRIHRHRRQEEVYLVLDGTLSLVIEGARARRP